MKNTTKKLFLVFGLASFTAAIVLFSGCSAQSVNKGLTKANEVNDELLEAKKEANEKYEAFKRDSDNRMEENERSIAKLRAGIKNKNEEDKAAFEKKVAELDQRNQSLKSKIKNYKVEGDGQIVSFILETTQEIDDLRKGIRELINQ